MEHKCLSVKIKLYMLCAKRIERVGEEMRWKEQKFSTELSALCKHFHLCMALCYVHTNIKINFQSFLAQLTVCPQHQPVAWAFSKNRGNVLKGNWKTCACGVSYQHRMSSNEEVLGSIPGRFAFRTVQCQVQKYAGKVQSSRLAYNRCDTRD